MELSSRIRAAILTIAALGLTLVVTACGGGGDSDDPGAQSLDLVIGAPLPAGLGDSGRKASDLALEQIRSAAGETGADHSVDVIDRNQGPDADTASEAAEKLVNSDHASCLTGPWGADAVLRTADAVAIPSEALLISPTPATEEISDLSDHDLVNSTALPVSLEGDALTRAVEGRPAGADGVTVNVAAGDDPYGNELSQSFTDAWQGESGTIGAQITIGSAIVDFSTSGLTASSPSAILLLVKPQTMLNIAGPLDKTPGWDPSIAWGGDALADPDLKVGPGVVDGMRVVAPGSPANDEARTAFIQAFRSAQPDSVRLAPYAAQEFDATILCYLASVAAGSTDGQEMADALVDITAPGGAKYTWEQLPEAVKALEKGEDIDYAGASGPVDLGITGNPTAGVYDVLEFSSGGLHKIGEEPVEPQNPAAP